MDLIQKFFDNIGRSDIDKNSKNLLSDGIIDSMDIVSLVAEIEKYYNKPLKSDFIKAEYFENFNTIQQMIMENIK
ncbi:phosphopantetheine-binding protein [Campylobacter sp. RM16704]|uniref:phosphopantetheine-binding protein n=1 Tax=Campylobacter sp. RM16704 TaxID=1500960 RepID=UPI00057FD285|nr:phosphopantetheine-binding protein [Campylobacter sp. RM16704]AJC86762.1 acyl carrier protein [Campylobacter sp. RM16704]